jgi:hypothetical protein
MAVLSSTELEKLRNSKCKRFGVYEVKAGKYKGGLHVSTKKYQEYHGELLYLCDYLNRRILPLEPEELNMTILLINLVNVLDTEMEKIIEQYYVKNPSRKAQEITRRIKEGFVSFKEKFDFLFDKKLIDINQYYIMEDLRKLRNKHTHYRCLKTRPKFRYLNQPLMTKRSLRNIFIDCAFVLRNLRKLSANKTRWHIIPPGYAEELNWGNLQDIYAKNSKMRGV